MRTIAISLTLLLSLGGCAEILVRAAADAAYLHSAARGYVQENVALRQSIRKACRDSVERQTLQLIEAGDEPAVREMLRQMYPPLVTMTIINKSLDDPEKSILSGPPGCG